MEKLQQLINTYPTSKESQSDYLDARYFNAMFQGYGGWVKEPLVVRITLNKRTMDEKEWKMPYNFRQEPAVPLNVHLSDQTPDIIRVIVEIERRGKVRSRHSNLLVLDPSEKLAYRFEPMFNPDHSEVVDQFLHAYLAKNAPGYQLVHAKEHPQKSMAQYCPNRGFCAAYVMKFAAMYILPGVEVSFSSDPTDILRFTHKVKTMYKPEMLAMYGEVVTKDEDGKDHVSIAGQPDIEYGTKEAIVGGAAGLVGGALVFGPIGAGVGLATGLVAGAASNNNRPVYVVTQ